MPGSDNSDACRKQPGDLVFLFWNLNNKTLLASVSRLVEEHEVDVLILAECRISPADVLIEINPSGRTAEFHYVPSKCARIALYTRFSPAFIEPLNPPDKEARQTKHSICKLNLPGEEELLLVAVHLLSLKDANEVTLYSEAQLLATDIRRVENEGGHTRTLVVGDFNMNPFADGLVSATALHATLSRSIALERTRQVQNRQYLFFYNPMWKHYVEHLDLSTNVYSPPGTYYYRAANHVCYFWNIFDQVLLRPDLLDRWDDACLHVLTRAGDNSLLTSPARHPGGRHGSDHLPIVFKLGPSS